MSRSVRKKKRKEKEGGREVIREGKEEGGRKEEGWKELSIFFAMAHISL